MTEGVAAAARMKWMAASRSTANVYTTQLKVSFGMVCGLEDAGGGHALCFSYPFSPAPSAGASTPYDVVWPDLVQNGLCLGLGLDVLDAADEDVELALQALAELLDRGDLLLCADDAGDRPRFLQQEGCQQLGDLAVAAEDEDVFAHACWCC